MNQSIPSAGILLIVIVVLALTVLLDGRWRKTLLACLLLVPAILGLLYLGIGRRSPQPPPAPRFPDREFAARISRDTLTLKASPGGSDRRFVVPDDLEAWRRDDVLGFAPKCPWTEPMTMTRKIGVVGDTEFIYWEPGSCPELAGFSEKEATREGAYRGARESAGRKLAALALLRAKIEQRGLDVAAVEPLARHIALGPDAYREKEVHYEMARLGYGDIHRAAVLVKADEKYIERIANALRKEVARGWIEKAESMRAWIMVLGAALMFGFMVFIVYTFLNAGTKGYFAWPLRAASLGLFLLICAGLYYLMRASSPEPQDFFHPKVQMIHDRR